MIPVFKVSTFRRIFCIHMNEEFACMLHELIVEQTEPIDKALFAFTQRIEAEMYRLGLLTLNKESVMLDLKVLLHAAKAQYPAVSMDTLENYGYIVEGLGLCHFDRATHSLVDKEGTQHTKVKITGVDLLHPVSAPEASASAPEIKALAPEIKALTSEVEALTSELNDPRSEA